MNDFSAEELANEEWRKVDAFPDYAVSNLGRVKRLTNSTRAKSGYILKIHALKRGEP